MTLPPPYFFLTQFILLVADEIKASDSFKTRREANIVIQHGLTVEEYDELHGFALASLIELTDLLKIQYNPYTTTYGDIMYLIDLHISRSTPEIQSEALALLMDIRPYSHLFAGRFSLLPAEDEDAVLQAWINVDKAVNKLISVVKSRKCKWCTQLAGYITGKACGKGGKAVCSGLAKLTGKLSKTVNKYVCGSPINLSNLFKNICVSAAKMVSRKSGVTPRNVCKKIKLPTLRWKTHSNKFFHISAKTVVLGRAC